MKTKLNHKADNCQRVIPFPNAATPREMLQKFLDLLIMGAVGAGFGAVALLLLAMG